MTESIYRYYAVSLCLFLMINDGAQSSMTHLNLAQQHPPAAVYKAANKLAYVVPHLKVACVAVLFLVLVFVLLKMHTVSLRTVASSYPFLLESMTVDNYDIPGIMSSDQWITITNNIRHALDAYHNKKVMNS